jgi:hypothetical protein
MRQVLSQLLDRLAPENEVRSYLSNKTASDSVSLIATPRKAKRRKVSFKTKIEFFANKHVSDRNLAKAVLESTLTFDSVYSNLNKIHTPAKLGEQQTKKALIQAETLLQLWLTSMGKLRQN